MGLELKYFVLRPRAKSLDDDYAVASCQALRAYAYSIGPTDRGFSNELLAWAKKEEGRREKLEVS